MMSKVNEELENFNRELNHIKTTNKQTRGILEQR